MVADEDDPEYAGKAHVADVVAERIERGEYRPGERIPSSSRIMAEFAVSKRVAVDAMELLQQRGLTIGSRGRGTRVRRPPERQEMEMTGGPDAETRRILAELAEDDVRPTRLDVVSVVRSATIGESDRLGIGRSRPVIEITRSFFVDGDAEPVRTAVQVLDAERWIVRQSVPLSPDDQPSTSDG